MKRILCLLMTALIAISNLVLPTHAEVGYCDQKLASLSEVSETSSTSSSNTLFQTNYYATYYFHSYITITV